jgi:hypothetical protein
MFCKPYKDKWCWLLAEVEGMGTPRGESGWRTRILEEELAKAPK